MRSAFSLQVSATVVLCHGILTGSMLQGLSVHRAKCNEKGVIRAIMICIRLRAFVILCLQFHCTEKVVQLRSSTASRYRAYLVNSMRFSI